MTLSSAILKSLSRGPLSSVATVQAEFDVIPSTAVLLAARRGQDQDDDFNYNQDYYPNQAARGQQRGSRYGASRNEPSEGIFSDLLRNQKQLGGVLVGVGLLLTFLGIMLFFEGNLLRLGNIAILAGVFLLMGLDKVGAYFLKESRMQATIITSLGILLVLFGKPKIGLLIEIFGLLNLFGNMFPVLLAIARKMPIIGDIITAVEGKSEASNTDSARKGRYGRAPQQPNRETGGRSRYQPDF